MVNNKFNKPQSGRIESELKLLIDYLKSSKNKPTLNLF